MDTRGVESGEIEIVMDFQKVSRETIEKLGELNRYGGLRNWLGLSKSHRETIIRELADTHESGIIPDLLNRALSSVGSEREAILSTLHSLLGDVPVAKLLDFDKWLRESMSHWGRWDGSWAELTPEKTASFSRDNALGVLCLATMHTNGRVRGAAVGVLASVHDGSELPFLILRLNDWVPQIRESARRAVGDRVHVKNARHFLHCLPLVLRVAKTTRSAHAWLIDAISLMLNEADSVLHQGLRSTDREVRRACLRFALAGGSANAAIEFALADSDPWSRLWAAKQLLTGASGEFAASMFARLYSDSFRPVRHEALTALLASDGRGACEAATAALLDRHSSIRALAMHHLHRSMNITDFYRAAIASETGAKLAAAILGFAETASSADVAELIPFLGADKPQIRRAVAKAVGKLDAESNRDALLKMVSDVSPSVSAAACSALKPVVHWLAEELESLVARHSSPTVRRNALKLSLRLNKWIQIPIILTALRDSSEHVSSMAKVAQERWFQRFNLSFIEPTPAQLERFEREFRKAREMSDGERREFEAILSQYRS